MATRFIEQATQQLAPMYQQQEAALQSQVPAIQNLYQTLYQGLEGQRATETQNILESAGSRGVLRSSMPVDLQTQLGQALLAERSKLGAQEAQELSGVRSRIGELGIARTSAIQQLADSLHNQDLKERQFQAEQAANERNYQLQLASARSSRGGGGGGSASNPVQPFIDQFASWMKGNKKMASRQQQDAFINSLFSQYGIGDRGARQVVWNTINAQFKRTSDPTKDWTWQR